MVEVHGLSASPYGGPPSAAQEAHRLEAPRECACEPRTKAEQGKHAASLQTHLSCICTSASYIHSLLKAASIFSRIRR